jgi:hypothetical protein
LEKRLVVFRECLGGKGGEGVAQFLLRIGQELPLLLALFFRRAQLGAKRRLCDRRFPIGQQIADDGAEPAAEKEAKDAEEPGHW